MLSKCLRTKHSLVTCSLDYTYPDHKEIPQVWCGVKKRRLAGLEGREGDTGYGKTKASLRTSVVAVQLTASGNTRNSLTFMYIRRFRTGKERRSTY